MTGFNLSPVLVRDTILDFLLDLLHKSVFVTTVFNADIHCILIVLSIISGSLDNVHITYNLLRNQRCQIIGFTRVIRYRTTSIVIASILPQGYSQIFSGGEHRLLYLAGIHSVSLQLGDVPGCHLFEMRSFSISSSIRRLHTKINARIIC